MTNGPDDPSQPLAAIAKQELQTILRSTGEVDAAFFYGRRLSVRWVSERARGAAAGMRRAGARISQEIPGSVFMRLHAKAEECLGHLAERLVGAHRHRLMTSVASRIPTVVSTSCGYLSSELSRERLYAVEAIYRSL